MLIFGDHISICAIQIAFCISDFVFIWLCGYPSRWCNLHLMGRFCLLILMTSAQGHNMMGVMLYIGTTHNDDDRDGYFRKAPLLIITYVNALYLGLLVCLYLSISIHSLGSKLSFCCYLVTSPTDKV